MGDTSVRAFGLTDVGLVRAANEDSFTMAELSKASRWQGGKCADWPTTKGGVLLVVSDGMGGAKAGEVASALSVEAVLGGMLLLASLYMMAVVPRALAKRWKTPQP